MRFLRLLVDERRAAAPEASLNRFRGMLRIAKRRAQAYSGASIWPALRGAQGEIQGVELVRSPMRADDSSARFISMSLKTSKYSLGGALCCCRVQPVPTNP